MRKQCIAMHMSVDANVLRARKVEFGARAAHGRRGDQHARPVDLPTHTGIATYTVGHEKSCPFAGCPYQRKRGNFHLSSSRGHTALANDRRAVRP
ncbi:hypothetical protein K1T71_009336 [Dendrolimus kikuchii]|uniref:Uncharacterized protein n=1 Tax=Dendrolimus kikuchii TaxID=765133 RepID=A0ACC1CUI6_9NEOP|nr:hypothetical protein K1T71_009336 [Dendrolimus kikuchii]